MLEQILTRASEAVLNNYIYLDSAIEDKLIPLQNKILKIDLSFPELVFFITIDKNKLMLTSSSANPPHGIIRTSSTSIARQFLFYRKTTKIDKSIELSGDLKIIQLFADLLENIEVDWEEKLSRILGDVFSYPIIQFIKQILHVCNLTQESVVTNITEYIQEEKKLSPNKQEQNDFFKDIAILRDDVERLECHIERIIKKHQEEVYNEK